MTKTFDDEERNLDLELISTAGKYCVRFAVHKDCLGPAELLLSFSIHTEIWKSRVHSG